MMRIVIDGQIYRGNLHGGIVRYWTETLRALARCGSDIHFDVVVARNSVRPAGLPLQTAGKVSAYWAAWRADLFQSTYYTRWPRMKCPSVATAYDFIDASFPEHHPNGKGFFERQFDVLRQATAVIAISQSTRDLAIELAGIDPARIFIAYPAVAAPFSLSPPGEEDIRQFRQEHTGGAPYLLHVGKCRTYKNFMTILGGFNLAAKKTDRHLLVLGGPRSWTTEEMKRISASQASGRVHFYPQASDEMLRLAYAGADALVHASLMEGFGIPVIEALACGTGLILSDIPVYREIAEGMATFVEAGNVEAWAEAIKGSVAIQPSWRDEVLRRYTWEATAQMHVRAYESVLG
jgi:glycosyltransferase involved in cell wall biosynthesis